MLRVVIIGAGASGLSACRHFSHYPERFELVCYEQCEDIGGSFLQILDANEYECLTQPTSLAGQRAFSIYKQLRCNLPAQLMAFPDYPFQPKHITEKPHISEQDLQWHFPTGTDMLNYARDYVEHYGLAKHIRLNEQVTLVRRNQFSPSLYTVTTRNVKSHVENSEVFDIVVVCSGHYAKPKFPAITDIDKYQGRYMHCKFYRGPAQEAAVRDAKKVLLYGACVTGPDIALNIAERAANEVGHEYELVLAGHNDLLFQKPNKTFSLIGGSGNNNKVRCVPDIEAVVGPRAVKLTDGSVEHNVDVIIVNTGFAYYFPFLWDDLALAYDNNRLQPLYKHLVHINHPENLFFIGLHHFGIGWRVMDMQVRYVVALLRGQFQLPSREAMLADEERDFQARQQPPLCWPPRFAHKLYKLGEAYCEELARESGIEKTLSKSAQELFDRICTQILANPERIRTLDYKNRADEALGIKL